MSIETSVDQTTVLVIEDDQEINELLGEYLTLEQIRYIQALSGQAGLQQASATHPDAVILDLMLPDVDGYEVARQLTTHRATFDVPVLMLTCMNQECDRHKGFASGALHFMNKPFLPDDLLTVLKDALEWRRNLRSRVPRGTILVSNVNPMETLRQLNNMIADLFARTSLSDTAVGQIREAFESLAAWSLEWGEKNQRDPKLSIDYRILAGDALANGNAATAVEWTLSEATPGLLAAAFFAGKAGAAPATTAGFSLTGTLAWAFGRTSEKAIPALPPTSAGPTPSPVLPPPAPASSSTSPPTSVQLPDAAGTAANWFTFLGKTGAVQFDRDSANRAVRFVRALNGEHGVPVVSADGARAFPHRIRTEALAARRK